MTKEMIDLKPDEKGCPVCGGYNYPGGLCNDCREAERNAEERRKQVARRRAFGGWNI